MVSRYVTNFNLGIVHPNSTTTAHLPPPPTQNANPAMPIGVAMATAVAATASITAPPQQQQIQNTTVVTVSATSQQQHQQNLHKQQQHHQLQHHQTQSHQHQPQTRTASQMMHQQQQSSIIQSISLQQQQHQGHSQQHPNIKMQPGNPQDYHHLYQCIVQNQGMNGPHLQQQQQQQQAQQQTHQHYRIRHSRSDGYVAASSAGFSAPQSGPPHQGPQTVIRGMQTATPSTPPQNKELNKMQQPSQAFGPSGSSNNSANVRQQQPQFIRSSPATTRNIPRHNSAIISQPMYATPSIQPVLMQYHQQQFSRSVQFPPPRFQAFQQFPIQNPFSGQTQIYFQNAPLLPTSSVGGIPAAAGGGQHRVPSVVQTSSGQILAGPNGSPAQSQILTASGVLTQATANSSGQTQVAGVQVAGGNTAIVGTVVSGTGQQPAGSGMSHSANNRRKQGKHAIPIIDPATNKNVLEDFINNKSQNTVGNELEYQETQLANNGNSNSNADVVETTSLSTEYVDPPKNKQGITYTDVLPKMTDILAETPIVSAKTNAPSVEIPPQQKPQKRKNKNEMVTPVATESNTKTGSEENNRNSNTNNNQKSTLQQARQGKLGLQVPQDLKKLIAISFQKELPTNIDRQSSTGTNKTNQPYNNNNNNQKVPTVPIAASVSSSSPSSSTVTTSIPNQLNNKTNNDVQHPTQQQQQHQQQAVQSQTTQHQYLQKDNKLSGNHCNSAQTTSSHKYISGGPATNTLSATASQSSTVSQSKIQSGLQQQHQALNRNNDNSKQPQQTNRYNNNNSLTTESSSNSINSTNINNCNSNFGSTNLIQQQQQHVVSSGTGSATQVNQQTTMSLQLPQQFQQQNNKSNILSKQATQQQKQQQLNQHYSKLVCNSDTLSLTSSLASETTIMDSTVETVKSIASEATVAALSAPTHTSSATSNANNLFPDNNNSTETFKNINYTPSKDEIDHHHNPNCSTKLDNVVDILNNNDNNNANSTKLVGSEQEKLNKSDNGNNNKIPTKTTTEPITTNLADTSDATVESKIKNKNETNSNNSNDSKLDCGNLSNGIVKNASSKESINSFSSKPANVNENDQISPDNPALDEALDESLSETSPSNQNLNSSTCESRLSVTKASNKKSIVTSVTATIPSTAEATTSNNNVSSTTACSTDGNAVQTQLIEYNHGQWSPHNRDGNKVYDREQLLSLRTAPLSVIEPQVNGKAALILLSNARSSQPNLMPTFARTPNNKRYQSMGNPLPSGSSNSMGANSFLKNHSTSIVNPKNNSKGSKSGMIHVTLSLREDVKLNETENAWRPSHFLAETMTVEERNREELKRKVRGVLNKLTPEKFEPLVEQIMKLQIDTSEKVNEVMILVFEKAIDEPNFSVSYASLCSRLAKDVVFKSTETNNKESSSSSKNLTVFRNALLDKTEHEFNTNITNQASKDSRLGPIIENLKECQDPEKRLEIQAQLEEEERKIRRRSGGTVRFIGELYKLSMLTNNIIRHCITHLLDPTSEDKLECLCKLLTTVGKKYESTPVDQKFKNKCLSLDSIIKEMQNIVDKREGSKISNRIRFMLQNVIDLRKNQWISSKTEIPKTMDQIQKDAKTEQLSNQFMNYNNSIGGSMGGNSGNSIGSSSGSGNNNMNKKDNDNSNGGGGRRGGNNFNNSVGGYGSNSSGGGNSSMSYGGGNNSGAGGNNRGDGNYYNNKSRNGNNQQQDGDWHTQTSKGKAIDANKLGQMSSLYDMDTGTTKLGASSQFIWNQPKTTSTTSNSFAALSSLDSNKNSSVGSRNKGSFSKGSAERDRFGSAHGSRESSSSRNQSSSRNDMNDRMRDRDNIDRRDNRHERSSSGMGTQKSSQQNYGMSNNSSLAPLSALLRPPAKAMTGNTQGTNQFPQTAIQFQQIDDVDLDEFIKALKKIVDLKLEDNNWVGTTEEITATVLSLPEAKRWALIFFTLNNYLHLAEVKSPHRKALAEITETLVKLNLITLEHIKKGCLEFSPIAYELCTDVPLAWQYIFEFFGPLIFKKLINIRDIWNDELKKSHLGQKFLKSLILYFTQEIGPNYMRELWRVQNLKWAEFLKDEEINTFISQNKFQFVYANTNPYEVTKQEDLPKVFNRVKEILKESSDKDAIIDYLSGNISTINRQFIRGLTTELLNSSIVNIKSNLKLDENHFVEVCSPLLKRYINSKFEYEMECLYAVQTVINNLEYPPNLLIETFDQLYIMEIINHETFISWRDSKEEPTGKGVAVKALNPFFNGVLNGETSDENN